MALIKTSTLHFLPVLLVFFCLVKNDILQKNNFPKCCDYSSYVVERNSSLICEINDKRRLQVFTENDNFLKTHKIGACVDSNEKDFFIYEVNDSKIISKHLLNVSYIPKCCPLKMVYNPTKKSCTEEPNGNEKWINGNFIKVGLPNCKLITDTRFSNFKDFQDDVRDRNENFYCMDKDVTDNYMIRECQKDLSICDTKRCIRKCCPDGQSFINGGVCEDTYVHGLTIQNNSLLDYANIENPEDEFEIIYNAACRTNPNHNGLTLYLLQNNSTFYNLSKNGVWSYKHHANGIIEEAHDHPESYCIEHIQRGNNFTSEYRILGCLFYGEESTFYWTYWSQLVSCVMLVATVAVSIIIGDASKISGKILINYCVAMFGLMVLIINVNTNNTIDNDWKCKLKGYMFILFELALYTWLNVMCLDIWWNLRPHPKPIVGKHLKSRTIIILYAIYGWGFPLCNTLFILLLETIKILPYYLHPTVGVERCFIDLNDENYAIHLFILVPTFIIQIVNMVLFVKAAVYCIRMSKQTGKVEDNVTNEDNFGQNNSMANKKRLSINIMYRRLKRLIKLSVVMGVCYFHEVVAAAFLPAYYQLSTFPRILEIILDNITALQGVFIFIIFICRRKTINFFLRKFAPGSQERRDSCTSSPDMSEVGPANLELRPAKNTVPT